MAILSFIGILSIATGVILSIREARRLQGVIETSGTLTDVEVRGNEIYPANEFILTYRYRAPAGRVLTHFETSAQHKDVGTVVTLLVHPTYPSFCRLKGDRSPIPLFLSFSLMGVMLAVVGLAWAS